MTRFELLACAENLIVDPVKDTFTIVNIIEDIASESFPFVMQPFQILLITAKEDTDPDTVTAVLNITNNESSIIEDTPITIEFAGKNKANSRFKVSSLVIPNPGKVTISVKSIDNTNTKIFTINIQKREKPKVEQESSNIKTPPVTPA